MQRRQAPLFDCSHALGAPGVEPGVPMATASLDVSRPGLYRGHLHHGLRIKESRNLIESRLMESRSLIWFGVCAPLGVATSHVSSTNRADSLSLVLLYGGSQCVAFGSRRRGHSLHVATHIVWAPYPMVPEHELERSQREERGPRIETGPAAGFSGRPLLRRGRVVPSYAGPRPRNDVQALEGDVLAGPFITAELLRRVIEPLERGVDLLELRR